MRRLLAVLLVLPLLLGAVSHDSNVESHTGTTGSVSEASFTFSLNVVSQPEGILVFTFVANASNDDVTAVCYGGTSPSCTALSKVSGGEAVDSAGEPGRATAWFLGSSVPSNDPATITVTRTNNADTVYAIAIAVQAATNTEVYAAGIVLVQGDTTNMAEQSVSDGSTGVDSVRFAAGYRGGNNIPSTGGSSTTVQNIDFGSFTVASVRETTAGQGSRSVGVSDAITDDAAFVHLAVREVFSGPARKVIVVGD